MSGIRSGAALILKIQKPKRALILSFCSENKAFNCNQQKLVNTSEPDDELVILFENIAVIIIIIKVIMK